MLTTPAFKLKPKVAAPPASSGNTAPAAASLPPAVAPNLTQPPAFALKPPAVAATPATPVSVPPPPPVGLIPPGPPGSAPVAAKPPTAPPPKLHLTAAPFAPEASLQPKPPAAVKAATLAARNKAGRKRILILGGTAALVLVAAVLFLWQTYFSSPPAPPPRPAVATTTPKPAPAPASVAPTAQTLTQTAQNLAAQPGQAVTNIQTALADARGREQARVDAVLDGKDPPDQRALNTPPPGTFTPQGVQAGPNGPPAAVGNPPPAATPPVAPASTIAFRAWVDSVKIGGVNGTGTLAFINGQTHRPGDMLDSAQGIVFDSADPAKKVLVFRDRTGAVVQKKY